MHLHTSTPKFVFAFAALLTTLLTARTASAETLTLMWDANPESTVVGYIVHVGTQSGSYTQHVDVGPQVTWLFPNAVAGQRYCFTVSAYATGPLEGPHSTEVCGYSNMPPTLTSPGNQTSIAGQADSLQLAASDPDGMPVTYSAVELPPGLTLMASTGFISGTPTTAGTFNVTATVSDSVLTASRTFTWSVQQPDSTAPVVTITTPTSAATHTTSGSSINIGGTATDAVGVTQVTWVNNRGGNGTATGTGTWSASSVALATGTNVLTVTARDAAGNTSSDVLTVTRNTAPTLVAVAAQTSTTGLATTLQLVGADADGNALTYSATNLPPGLLVAATTGLISGTPNAAGTYNVTASVSDGVATASRAFTWTITASNAAPALEAVPNQSTEAGRTASLQLVGSDTNGDMLTYGANGLPPGLALAVSTGVIVGTPTTPGSYAITATVSDGMLTATRTFVWTVTPPASLPLQVTLTTDVPSPQLLGSSVTFVAAPTGGAGPYLFRWSVLSRNSWKVVQSSSSANTFTWSPSKALSTYLVRVEVRSATGELVSATLPFVID